MPETTSDNFVAFTPEIKRHLADVAVAQEAVKAREQALLDGFLAGKGKSGGKWKIMPDGSGLLRDDEVPK